MYILTPEHEQFYGGLKSSMGITVKLVLGKNIKDIFLEIYRTCHAQSLVYTIDW